MRPLLCCVRPSQRFGQVWTVPGQRFQSTLNGHSNWVRSCCFSPDGRLAASCGDDKAARVWDLRTKKTVRRYEGHGGAMNTIQFHPDGTCVATGMTDSSIRVWDIRTDTLLQLYQKHDGAVTGEISPIARKAFPMAYRVEISSERKLHAVIFSRWNPQSLGRARGKTLLYSPRT